MRVLKTILVYVKTDSTVLDQFIELPHSQEGRLIEFPKIGCPTQKLLFNI